MKNNLFCLFQLVFLCCMSVEIQPVVIFLNGTSSAGKSSIAKELHELFGQKYELFQYDTYQPQINFCKDIRKKAQQGKHVIVDAIISSFASSTLQYLDGLDICFVLVYAPLLTLIEHVQKRNILQNSKETRTLYSVFMNYFVKMYQRVIFEKEELDIIAWDEFEKNSYAIDDEQKRNKVLKIFKDKFLRSDYIRYKPAYEYDFVVNTSMYSSRECAEQIITYVQGNRSRIAFQKNYRKHNTARK